MIRESINLLTEKMQVWKDIDVNNFINLVYQDAMDFAEKAKDVSGFTSVIDGRYLYHVPKWKPKKEYTVKYLNQNVNVIVFYNRSPIEQTKGTHYSNSHIDLFIPYKPAYRSIQDIVYHEFNHEFCDRIKDVCKSPYYDNKTIDFNILAKNGWRKWSNEWIKAVDEVLYRLWSREERDSYVAMSNTENFNNIKIYLDSLQKDIDILKKNGISFNGNKTIDGKTLDEFFLEPRKRTGESAKL